MAWYGLALFSLVAYGIQNFLYKVAAEKKCNTAWVMVAMMSTITVLSTATFFITGEPLAHIPLLILLSFVGGPLFLLALTLRTEALKNVSSSVAYPITRLSIIIVTLFSVFYFHEHLSIYQGAGIALALVVFVLLTRHNQEQRAAHPNFKAGVTLATLALFAGAGATLATKFVTLWFTGFFAFIALSNGINIILAFGAKNRLQREQENANHKNAIIIGTISGLFNFVGYYAVIHAINLGPLAPVTAVHSMNFVIAILLSVIIYKETLTKRRLAGIGLTVLALILLRI